MRLRLFNLTFVPVANKKLHIFTIIENAKLKIAPRYYRVTLRLIDEIFKKAKSERSFTSIAKEVNLSILTVVCFFDMLAFNPPKKLPEVLSIDEFKRNTGKEKYQVIITNPDDGTILDILPDRKQSHLVSYFKQ